MSDSKPLIPQKVSSKAELIDLQNSDDVEKLKSLLQPGEKVYQIVECLNDGSDGVLAATNKELSFVISSFYPRK